MSKKSEAKKSGGKKKAKLEEIPAVHVDVSHRLAVGKEARKQAAREVHAGWEPSSDRRDPIDLLEEQNTTRLPWLVPIRRGRMLSSPFAFYRGAARIMASDLSTIPVSGLQVQVCGDAHIANFGGYASPERELVFDLNDFDETLPGPWEWDVKRLAASIEIAARHRQFPAEVGRTAVLTAVQSYRETLALFSTMGLLEVWYAHLTVDALKHVADNAETRKRIDKLAQKARGRDNLQAFHKLTTEVDGEYRIASDPPLLVPMRELPDQINPDILETIVDEALHRYQETISGDRRHLLSRFVSKDVALKVVGVGSVGTRCLIVLLEGRDREDPLFLQVKEAQRSVLEEFLGPSQYDQSGQRVVEGQRLMQAVSDIFLGWFQGVAQATDFYVRQLRDWKISADLENIPAEALIANGRMCGWTLARAHARSGDAAHISGYLGTSDTFDQAIADFAVAYADQNERDYLAYAKAVEAGRFEAVNDLAT